MTAASRLTGAFPCWVISGNAQTDGSGTPLVHLSIIRRSSDSRQRGCGRREAIGTRLPGVHAMLATLIPE